MINYLKIKVLSSRWFFPTDVVFKLFLHLDELVGECDVTSETTLHQTLSPVHHLLVLLVSDQRCQPHTAPVPQPGQTLPRLLTTPS